MNRPPPQIRRPRVVRDDVPVPPFPRVPLPRNRVERVLPRARAHFPARRVRQGPLDQSLRLDLRRIVAGDGLHAFKGQQLDGLSFREAVVRVEKAVLREELGDGEEPDVRGPVGVAGKAAARVLVREEAVQAHDVADVVGHVISGGFDTGRLLEALAARRISERGDQGMLADVSGVGTVSPYGEEQAVPVKDEWVLRESGDESVEHTAHVPPRSEAHAANSVRIVGIAESVPTDVVEIPEEDKTYI